MEVSQLAVLACIDLALFVSLLFLPQGPSVRLEMSHTYTFDIHDSLIEGQMK